MAAEAGRGGAADTLRVHAIVRGGWGRGLPAGWRLVEAGPVAAAVRPAGGESDRLRPHVRRVEALMREVPLAPLPPGLVARDEDAVRSFLERARLPVLEALELCEGRWELRVHLTAREEPDPPGGSSGPGDDDAADPAAAARRTHRALRRRARAVRRLPTDGAALLGAAYLVTRSRWIGFIEEVARREEGTAGLSADVTGPWAPWDFVRVFEERPA